MSAARKRSKHALRQSRALFEAGRGSVFYAAPNVARIKSFTNATKTYYVLLGAQMGGAAPPRPPVRCRLTTKKSEPVVFNCVSSTSVLGPPYLTAVACTCPDWEQRSGLSPLDLEDAESAEDASAGCKHMMLCNAILLKASFVAGYDDPTAAEDETADDLSCYHCAQPDAAARDKIDHVVDE